MVCGIICSGVLLFCVWLCEPAFYHAQYGLHLSIKWFSHSYLNIAEKNMTIKVGVNGFGRIGRLVIRAAWDWDDIEFIQINDPGIDLQSMAHLLNWHGLSAPTRIYRRGASHKAITVIPM